MSFDIESGKGENDELYCIGFVCGNARKVFINSSEKIDNAISCKNEEEVIERFLKEIIDLDPDVITGWNVIVFDLEYLNNKCRKYKIDFGE